MSIREILGKIKTALKNDHIFYSIVVILVGIASFGLGRLSMEDMRMSPPLHTLTPHMSAQVVSGATSTLPIITKKVPEKPSTGTSKKDTESTSTVQKGQYVGSKNGSKYHLPWCGGAQRINEENKIWFADRIAAEKAGYTPATNCPGI